MGKIAKNTAEKLWRKQRPRLKKSLTACLLKTDSAVTDKCIKAMEEVGRKYVEMPEER